MCWIQGDPQLEPEPEGPKPASKWVVVQKLDAAAAAELQKQADEFHPTLTESMDASFVRLCMAQCENIATIPAFMVLCGGNETPDAGHLQAIRAFTKTTTEVPDQVIDSLVWLWTGGAGASTAMLKEMVAPPPDGQTTFDDIDTKDGFVKGQLDIIIVGATGLCTKCDSFATVRVEGHQRNTQVVKSTKGALIGTFVPTSTHVRGHPRNGGATNYRACRSTVVQQQRRLGHISVSCLRQDARVRGSHRVRSQQEQGGRSSGQRHLSARYSPIRSLITTADMSLTLRVAPNFD